MAKKKNKSTKKVEDFIHFHTHSDMSQLDGCGKIPDFVKETAARGGSAIAFTEHGTMRGYYSQHNECKEHGVNPIYGTEFYIANDMKRKGLTDEEKADITKGLKAGERKEAIKKYEEEHGIRDRWHLTVWARTQEGLNNLFKLSSMSYIDGFYYKPRVDIEALCEYSEGLAVATGCLSSPINDRFSMGQERKALQEADRLRETFGENLWIEVQPHAIDEQVEVNKFGLKLQDRWGKHARLLATMDSHYVEQEDWEHHEVLLCIGTNDRLSNPDRFKFDGDEFFMKNRKQMFEAFRKNHSGMPKEAVKRALDNTLVLASQCTAAVDINYHAVHLPEVGIPAEYADDWAYMKGLCLQGWTWREIPRRASTYAIRMGVTEDSALAQYRERLKYELAVLKRNGFVSYFLIVHDLYNWARSESIMCGPGRGSVAGSLVAYLLGLTAVDPIEHGLIFERFINPDRIDMPDVDMDFEDIRRQEIIEYLRQKYGEDKVCQIATIGKLSGKQCLKDVSRVLEVPYAEVNEVTASIIERSSGDERASQTIADSFRDFKVCREFDKKYPKVLHHAKRLEGMAKNLGIHAAGVIVSPFELASYMPMEIRKYDGRDVVVSAIDMYGVASQGLVKLDVLGLRTLTVLSDCVKAIKERHEVEIDLEAIELNDPLALQGFTDHDYVGIFQYDTPSADKVCSGVEFALFEDITAMTALNRPGTARSGLATQYVARKKDPKKVSEAAFHPAVSEITKDTLGIIVYQEHVIKIFTDIAGFAPGTADSLRKTIAKKIGDETLGKERGNFIAGAKKMVGMDEETAGKIMDAITFFGCVPWWTQISVPGGATSIDTLSPGDRVFSLDSDGNHVENVIKSVSSTGPKDVFVISTKVGSVNSSADHWWLCSSGEYKKTSQLRPGMLIAYATDYDCESDEELLIKGLSSDFVLPWDVSNSLPTMVSNATDGDGESGWKQAQQARAGSREGVEKGREQKAPEHRGASESDQRREESRLERRACHGVSSSQESDFGKGEELPALRSGPGFDPSSAEHEGASCAPQGSGQDEQRGNEFGSNLPKLPQQGALGGKAGWWVRIEEIEQTMKESEHAKGHPAFDVTCYDIEVENEPRNYIADGFVCHNSYGFNKSHATAYSMIAYWGMWLKKRYPIEFYWALLKNEPQRLAIQHIAKDAKDHDIELLPPHVSVSKKHFAIDNKNEAIRGSLVDIKGVGEAAATTIMANQPYEDMWDMLQRVDRRKCHKGVIVALVKSGAMEDFVPNVKWFIENIEDIWALVGKKKWDDVKSLVDASSSKEEYPEEERQLLAAQVNPLAFGAHPIDAYEDFIAEHVKVPMKDMSHEDFFSDWDNQGVFIHGVIVEVKYNQIGDFHTGEDPTDLEKKQMFWGSRYANVNVEDPGGTQNRIKFDFDIFDDNRPIIDAGIGTPVIVHVTPNKKFENLKAHFAIDLEEYRKKVADGKPLGVWEKIVAGEHPALTYAWPEKSNKVKIKGKMKRVATAVDAVKNIRWRVGRSDVFTGVVTHVRQKYDKNGNLMAFFGVIAGDNRYLDALCFRTEYGDIKKHLTRGRFVQMTLDIQPDRMRGRGAKAYIFSGRKLRLMKKSAR